MTNFRPFKISWRSLRTRITFGMLLGVVCTLWIATFVISKSLRHDMEEALSAQQYSVVSLLAAQVDSDVRDRIRALELVASQLGKTDIKDFGRLKNHLDQSPVFMSLFNWGVIVTDQTGKSILSLPLEFKRTGADYGEVAIIRKAFSEGRTVIGDALIGPTTRAPMIPIATPIPGKDGKVIGLIVGLTNLTKPNFLDEIGANRFGKQGGYLITEPHTRTFIAATDKSRVMRTGPPKGVNAVYDSYIDGREGSGIAKSSRGVVELSSSKRIPSTGWLMQSVLPADEAFEPIKRIEQQLLLTSILLTLLAGASAWWWLRGELSPLAEASQLLEDMRDGRIERQALPIRNHDEIGQLADAFNGLLTGIVEQEKSAAENAVNARLRMIVSNVPGVVFQYMRRPDGSASLPFVSDAVADISGQTGQSLLEDWSPERSRIHPEDQERLFATLRDSELDLVPWHCDYRIHDGEVEKHLQIHALPERDADGSTLWHGFLTDVSRLKETEGELRVAAATFETQQGMFITDSARRIQRVNRAFTELTGYQPEDVIGRTPSLLRPDNYSKVLYENMYAELDARGKWVGELWARRKNGEMFAVWNTFSAVRDADGRITHYVAAFSDVTERRLAEDKLRKNKDLMQAILNAIQESIFLLDPKDRVIAVNPTAAHRLNLEPKDMIGKDLFDLFPPGLAEDRRLRTHQVVQSGKPAVDEDERGGRTFSNSFYPLFDKQGNVEAVVVVASDITARKHLERNLELQARTDPLTELYNRRHFMVLAESELARATRYGARLSAIMLDIDHFKRINDSRGHRTGDLVLQNLAKLIHKILRDVDIVGRLGGEEFAILLPETGGAQAGEVAERLRTAVAASQVLPDAGLSVRYTISLGVATVGEDTQTNVDTLLNDADQAMYAAKRGGRNRVCHHAPPV